MLMTRLSRPGILLRLPPVSASILKLMAKYRFLETLVDHTPVTTIRLSRQYLESLEESARAR